MDLESAAEAEKVIAGLYSNLNSIRSRIATAQNEIEKSYDISKNTIDIVNSEVSELETTDVPIELALMMQFEMAESAGVEVLTKEFKIRDLLLKILQ